METLVKTVDLRIIKFLNFPKVTVAREPRTTFEFRHERLLGDHFIERKEQNFTEDRKEYNFYVDISQNVTLNLRLPITS